MEEYQVIDINTWQRKIHYAAFKDYAQPQYSISFELDATHLYQVVKQRHWSFTYTMAYLAAKTGNEIIEFRYRFEGEQVVLYHQVKAAFTYLNQSTNLYKNLIVPMQDTIEEFLAEAARINNTQQDYFDGVKGNGVFQMSPIPWIAFTHISHTDNGKKGNSVPKFDWGKFHEKDGKWILPFAIQAHHSFVDGIHMGQFAQTLQERMNQL